LNSANAGSYAGLADNLKCADLSGVGYMGSATELNAPVSAADYPHLVSILFTEQGHGAHFLRLLHRGFAGLYRQKFGDLLVDQLFDLFKHLRRNGFEMGKVKTKRIFIYAG